MRKLNDAKIVLRKRVAMPGSIDTYHDSSIVLRDEQGVGRKELNARVFEDARVCFDNLNEFRRRARRCHRYTFGDQWGDRIDVGRTRMTESTYIKQQGKIPLKNNMIRQLVKSVLGQYESIPTRPVCIARDRKDQTYGEMMTIAMEGVYDSNKMDSLDYKTLQSYLITGVAVHKTSYTWLSELQRHDVFVRGVSPYKVFFDNRMEDHAYRDLSLIGELHDMSISDVVRIFAGSDAAKSNRIRRMYGRERSEMSTMQSDTLVGDKNESVSFYTPEDANMCRVIEVWRREAREFLHCHDTARGRTYRLDVSELDKVTAENALRLNEGAEQGLLPDEVALVETSISIDNYWYVRFFTPYGDVLAEYENPYWHGSHPYTLSIYPFINGEAHSFVEDIIDQQRYINRLITMIDFIMGASAKGVLLMPEDAIPDNMSIEDIEAEWVKYNGVILFKSKPGQQMPTQISTNATNIGAYELLNLQMKLLQDISGVQNALQGKTPRSGTSGVQYQQEALNAQGNLTDLLNSYRDFRENRDIKIVKLMQQYEQDDHYMNTCGSYSEESREYKADKVRDIDFTLSINESPASPTYRLVANDLLLKLVEMQVITPEDMLENGSFPNGDRILQSIQRRKQELMEQQQQMMAAQGNLQIQQ